MPDTRYNLLAETLIPIRTLDGSEERLPLPETLARLSSTEVSAFPGLQPHQYAAWHAFLVQVGAIALHREAIEESPDDPAAWASLLRALTNGSEDPWSLVVTDLRRPAFMQPPVPEDALAAFKQCIEQPDQLDVLVTAKNHDIKAARIARPEVHHWIYALVSLQTMQGFSGRDNYGIARMNSGFGSRPLIGYSPGFGWSGRFQRDLKVLQAARSSLVGSEHGYPKRSGIALLWLEPWDGRSSLTITQCDPFFIEVCRRVRLVVSGDRVYAHTAPSKAPRIAAKELKGNTGDPWTPVKTRDSSALTVSGAGFTYAKVQDILFGGDWARGAAAQVYAWDPETLNFEARALARGQGKTAGLHHRSIPIPAKVRYALGRSEERDRLGAMAKERVEFVRMARRKVLHPALCVLLQGGPERLDFRDERSARWTNAFERDVDRIFFHRLWGDAELAPDGARQRWAEELRNLAWRQLQDATCSAPVPIARRYRAIAGAERLFNGAWRRNFEKAPEETTEKMEVT